MKNSFAFPLLLFVIIINTGCPKPCIEANYTFAVMSQIVPDRDSINIGDTIYLTSVTPKAMKDLNTGIIKDYSGAKSIGSNLGIGELIPGNNISKDAVFDFNYFSLKGM